MYRMYQDRRIPEPPPHISLRAYWVYEDGVFTWGTDDLNVARNHAASLRRVGVPVTVLYAHAPLICNPAKR